MTAIFDPDCADCDGDNVIGRMSSHDDLATANRDGKAIASTYVCGRAEHQAAARAWVQSRTGAPAVLVHFKQ